MDIKKSLLEGDKRAIAKAITLAENEDEKAIKLVRDLYKETNDTYIIGITGPPGVGKSTLTDKVVDQISDQQKSVGVIAVDPSSPFTGGALLGDRIRMQKLSLKPNVFIRSMGTRGQLGGLAKATKLAIRILAIAGMDYVFLETVGVGQSEVDIVKTADTTTMVMAPGMGDDIQAIKAGIMEIGDVFVVNKADKDGVARKMQELQMALDLGDKKQEWTAKVLKTVAKDGEGIKELIDLLQLHRSFLETDGRLSKLKRSHIKQEILQICQDEIAKEILNKLNQQDFQNELDKIINKELDPYLVADRLLNKIK